MPVWLCVFDLEDADDEDYEEIYIRVCQAGGKRYWKNDEGNYYRYPSTAFKLPMESTTSSDALNELERFLKSCTTKKITHSAIGGDNINAWSVPIDAESVPQEVRDIIG